MQRGVKEDSRAFQHKTCISIFTNVFQKFKCKHICQSFPCCSLNLPLTQHRLQRALDHNSVAKVHQFNQSQRQDQNYWFLTSTLVFNLQLPLIQLYLDFNNKSIFKIRKLFITEYHLLENPKLFSPSPSPPPTAKQLQRSVVQSKFSLLNRDSGVMLKQSFLKCQTVIFIKELSPLLTCPSIAKQHTPMTRRSTSRREL